MEEEDEHQLFPGFLSETPVTQAVLRGPGSNSPFPRTPGGGGHIQVKGWWD